MSYDANKPANDDYISQGPAQIRENMRALKEDQIVDAATVSGKTISEIKTNVVKFTTTGLNLWTCPTGVSKVFVTAVGGGGGGGGSGDDGTYSGTGGTAGGIAIKEEVSVTPGTEYTIIVGAGGTQGTNGGAGVAGGDGGSMTSGDTSFYDSTNNLVTVSGGISGKGAGASANAASNRVDVLAQGQAAPLGALGGTLYKDGSTTTTSSSFGHGGQAGTPETTITFSGGFATIGGSEPGGDGFLMLEY